jgi:hypothetical protein
MFPPRHHSGAVLLWAPVPIEPLVTEGAGHRDEANKMNARLAQLPAMTVTISKRLIPMSARLSSY